MESKAPLAVALALAASAWGQSVISAHSGVIQLAEGQVFVDGQEVHQKFAEFGDVKTGQTLATRDGRAEVLLTPGVFLRVAENSSFTMVSNKLTDTRVEAVSGSVMLQVAAVLPDNAISVRLNGADVAVTKKGLYRFDADSKAVRVYDGEAKVAMADKTVTAGKGREVFVDTQMEAKNFDSKETDAFYRWCERRDEYVAQANVSAAKTARDSGMGYGSSGSGSGAGYGMGGYGTANCLGFGPGYGVGGTSPYGCGAGAGTWAFNPWFGMFTYVPFGGMFYSPYGFGYYSPAYVGYLYMPGSGYFVGRGVGVGASNGLTRNSVFSSSGTSTSRGLSTLRGSGPSAGGIGSSRGGVFSGGSSAPSFGGASVGGGGIGGGSTGGGMSGGMGGARGAGPSGGGGGGRH